MTSHIWQLTIPALLIIIFFITHSISKDYDGRAGGKYLKDSSRFNYTAKIVFSPGENLRQEVLCSAVIFRQKWVITATHCFDASDLETKNFKNYKVLTGPFDSLDEFKIEDVFVPNKKQHPELFKDVLNQHDIALVKTTVAITTSTNFLRLPPDDMNLTDLIDITLYVHSYGPTCFKMKNCPAERPKEVLVNYFPKDNCKEGNFNDEGECWCPRNDSSKMCAKVQKLKGFTGHGDSGGSLSDFHTLFGILSKGECVLDRGIMYCNDAYNDVHFYKRFIMETVGESGINRLEVQMMTLLFSFLCILF